MIITLIALGILTIGFIGYCIFKYLDTKLDKARESYWDAEHKVDNVRYQIMMMADSSEKKKEKEAELAALEAQRDKYAEVKKRYDHDYSWPGSIFLIICIFGLAASLISGFIIFDSHLPSTVETTIAEIEMERDSLVYRLESGQEIGNEHLFSEILDFNTRIYNYNYWYNNPWTSWFNAKEYTDILPIEYQK